MSFPGICVECDGCGAQLGIQQVVKDKEYPSWGDFREFATKARALGWTGEFDLESHARGIEKQEFCPSCSAERNRYPRPMPALSVAYSVIL